MAKNDSSPKVLKRLLHFVKKYYRLLLKLFLVAFLLLLFPSTNIYSTNLTSNSVESAKKPIDLPAPPLYPVNIGNIYPDYLTAEGVTIEDLHSGVILYSKNPDSQLSPASTTKIATALVALDHYSLDDVLTVKTVEHTKNVMGLVPDEKITFESLLYGLLVDSANDAAYTIAENYTGGVDSFVGAMNKKAQDLHLNNTHFTNPIGFDDANHYTTASDLTKLASVALRNKTISKIVGTRAITVSDVSFTYFHDLRNVNQLLGEIPGVAGVKTGYTENAAECLVTLVRRDNNEVLTVVLRSSDRFKETANLISWVFQNYKWVDIKKLQNNNLTGTTKGQ